MLAAQSPTAFPIAKTVNPKQADETFHKEEKMAIISMTSEPNKLNQDIHDTKQ
eukprot:Awhi_evm1s9778